jgi:hypothetical protein
MMKISKLKQKLRKHHLCEEDAEELDTARHPRKITVDMDLLGTSDERTEQASVSTSSNCSDKQLGNYFPFNITVEEPTDRELHPDSCSSTQRSSTDEVILELMTHTVRFSTVHIREYPICIGDNPSSLRGPPISLEWEYIDEKEVSLEANETITKRTPNELKTSSLDRRKMLKRAGFSGMELTRASKKVDNDRSRRQQTIRGLNSTKIQEYKEIATRAILNATVNRATKKREREFLEPYRKQT